MSEGRNAEPPDPIPQARQVFTARNIGDAYFVRGLLESEGIPAEIRNEALFAARGEVPLTPDTLPAVWVIESDVARARELLRDFYVEAAVSDQTTWSCPKCGESLESQFTACWNCRTEKSPAPD